MPKKQDPLAGVIRYFVVQDLAQVVDTLNVVKEIVRGRQGKPASVLVRPVVAGATAGAPPAGKKPKKTEGDLPGAKLPPIIGTLNVPLGDATTG